MVVIKRDSRNYFNYSYSCLKLLSLKGMVIETDLTLKVNMYPFFSVLLWLIIGAICSRTAKHRGRNPSLWFFLGILLGVIGLIILYILPPKKVTLATAPSSNPIIPPPIEVSPSLIGTENGPETTTLWYYLDEANKQYGPMSFNALQTAWDEDQMTSSTYVWNEQMENWQTLEEIPDLLDKVRRAPE